MKHIMSLLAAGAAAAAIVLAVTPFAGAHSTMAATPSTGAALRNAAPAR